MGQLTHRGARQWGATNGDPVRRRLLLGGVAALGASLALLGRLERVTAQTTATPEDVYQALLTAPFESGELPDGFTVRELRPIQTELTGLVGGVAVGLRGPDSEQSIWYYVFGTEADGQHHFDFNPLGRRGLAASASPDTTITQSFVPDDFEHPAWCVAGRSFVGGRHWPWSTCFTLVGSIEVGASCRAQPGPDTLRPDRDDTLRAIALARSGVAHLARVQAQIGQP